MGPIEFQPVRLVRETDKAAAIERARPADPVAKGEKDVEVSRSQLLEPSPPPIDAERVASIRQAIADGTYRLVPDRTADAMIAAVQASRNS